MVAIDRAFALRGDIRNQTASAAPIVLFGLLGSILLAVGTLVLEIRSDFAWRDAAEYVSRFSLLLFVASMVVEPLSRIVSARAMRGVGRERGSLVLSFAMASIVSLALSLTPSQLGDAKTAFQAFAYAVLTGGILVAMLFSAHPATRATLGGPAWRTMQRIATSYFWIVFTVIAIEHLIRTDLSDRWWGISLLLLVVALLIRITDAVLIKLRGTASTSEKAA